MGQSRLNTNRNRRWLSDATLIVAIVGLVITGIGVIVAGVGVYKEYFNKYVEVSIVVTGSNTPIRSHQGTEYPMTLTVNNSGTLPVTLVRIIPYIVQTGLTPIPAIKSRAQNGLINPILNAGETRQFLVPVFISQSFFEAGYLAQQKNVDQGIEFSVKFDALAHGGDNKNWSTKTEAIRFTYSNMKKLQHLTRLKAAILKERDDVIDVTIRD